MKSKIISWIQFLINLYVSIKVVRYVSNELPVPLHYLIVIQPVLIVLGIIFAYALTVRFKNKGGNNWK